MGRLLRFGLFVGIVGLAGCSTMGGSAIRTGPVQMPSYSGPVAIYSIGQPPAGAVDLGVVEVHAAQHEGGVETLLPQFVRKVADIGGNVAIVEGVRARFELAGHTQIETFYYTCALGSTCSGTRAYATNDETMIVSMFGRAMTTQLPDIGAPLIPKDSPLVPDRPPVDAGAPPTVDIPKAPAPDDAAGAPVP